MARKVPEGNSETLRAEIQGRCQQGHMRFTQQRPAYTKHGFTDSTTTTVIYHILFQEVDVHSMRDADCVFRGQPPVLSVSQCVYLVARHILDPRLLPFPPPRKISTCRYLLRRALHGYFASGSSLQS